MKNTAILIALVLMLTLAAALPSVLPTQSTVDVNNTPAVEASFVEFGEQTLLAKPMCPPPGSSGTCWG